MKKLLIALSALALVATAAYAGYGIDWTEAYAAYSHEATDLTGTDYYLLDSYSVTWQLIYAGADNTASPINLSNPGWVSGDDVVWATAPSRKAAALQPRTAPRGIAGWNILVAQIHFGRYDLDWRGQLCLPTRL